jgi:dihydropteroate synthase
MPDIFAQISAGASRVGAGTPLVMGILNMTPDSFSDGGRLGSVGEARDAGLAMLAAGADVLDLGGESTRPGAESVDEAEEIARVVPVIAALRKATKATLSIDTRKPNVARAAVAAGADVWNDVSALTFAPESIAVAAELGVPVVLMHARGDPKTMQNSPVYGDVVSEVLAFLSARIGACARFGIRLDQLILDPGIGFGKTLAHNLALIRNLGRFSALGRPILFGASRKSFIGRLDDDAPVENRLGGSVAAALWAARNGASIVRVHDVDETIQALRLWAAVEKAE